MDIFYDFIRFLHVISFVFMCVLLFNLIIANERIMRGISFSFDADKHIEDIIKSGIRWCYINQATMLITGLLLLILGSSGIEGLWTDWIVLLKTIILFLLMGTISYVQFNLQPKIESFLNILSSGKEIPDSYLIKLKPYRLLRKWLTSFYLFLVISAVVLGIQVYSTFNPLLTIILIVLTAVFSIFADKLFLKFGWI